MSKKVIAIVTDTEFTNFSRESGDLITCAMVEILDDYTIGRYKSWKARPKSPKYFTVGAQEVHGISYFKASTFPEARDTCLDILHWLAPLQDCFRLPLVFHGLGKLDFKWLESFFRREQLHFSLYKVFDENECIDTISLARKHIKHIQEPIDLNHRGELVGKYSLPNVCRFYKVELNHHEVLSDAMACAEIYCRIMKGEDTFTGDLFDGK